MNNPLSNPDTLNLNPDWPENNDETENAFIEWWTAMPEVPADPVKLAHLAFFQGIAYATESEEYVAFLESEAAKNATRRCANCQAALRPPHCCVCEGCDGCREVSTNS